MQLIGNTDALNHLEDHLKVQSGRADRSSDFDMNDAPEAEVLQSFQDLSRAVDWLAENISPQWRAADREALRSQSKHRNLARVAIFSGTLAIVLSVIQLALRLTFQSYSEMTGYFEMAIVAIAALAVLLGLVAKFDRQWLAQRNLAERLRMLKFRALEQFSCLSGPEWEDWVRGRLTYIASASDFASMQKWSKEGEVEPEIPKATGCDRDTAKALTIYYCHKRLLFQAKYFQIRRDRYERKTSRRRHLSLVFFLISVSFALVHFLADPLSHSFHNWGHHTISVILEIAAVWCAVMAAIIPVLGFGIRAWFSAFQLPLSATVYEAKNRALLHAQDYLEKVSGDFEATLYHIAHIEQFLRDEHREWLRLLLETEWFV